MEFENFEDLSNEPLEVRLVAETSKCRSCNWFWDPPPYGPYPSFDFRDSFPEVFRERTNFLFKDGDHAQSFPGRIREQKFVVPQLLHGCRKSPIMTIGINPNLTGFWPNTNGARWAYPRFDSFAKYAYYYRHRTTHQESLSIDFIRSHLSDRDMLVAPKAGYLKSVRRKMDSRQITVSFVFEDGETEEKNIEWTHERHFVLVVNRDEPFGEGDVVGGYLELPDDLEVPVQQNVVGYYQRVIPILEQVSAWLRSQSHLPNLEMSEDVCQLDMVACASPGWGKVYQIDKSEVVPNCVQKHSWVVKQLIQSNPKVIIFSGRSAFQMFNEIFKPFISPNLADEFEVYGLMKMTARDPHYLDISVSSGGRDYRLRSRLIISPHFSYDDNFEPHSRMGEAEIDEFAAKFESAYSELNAQERVSKPNRDGYVGIRTSHLKSWVEKHPVAAIPIMQKHYDPSAMIGQGIVQEILLGSVEFDGSNNHLQRSEGPCKFCVNDSWSFPEGCAYGKTEEPEFESGFLEDVVQQVQEKIAGATA